MKGAELVVASLAAEGVTQVYGIPGTTIMDVLDVLAQQDRIRYLSVRHEQVAGFMADGYSRASGEVGVCIASRGPGATNLATAIGNAYDESVPLVALVGSVAHDLVERRAFEEIDVASVFRPLTKWTAEVPNATRIPEFVQRAVRTAQQGRPGPVVVSLPLDVLTASADVEPAPPFRVSRPRPAPEAVRAAAEILRDAEAPTLVVGGGARPSGALTALAERLGAAVVTTWSRKDRFPNRHPAFVGALGAGALPVADEAVRSADVLLALGCRFSEFTTKRWTLVRPETRIVQVDIDPDQIGTVYPVAVGIHGDAELTAIDLLAALDARAGSAGRVGAVSTARRERLMGLRAAYADQSTLPAEDDAPPGTVPSARLTDALRVLLEERPLTLVVDAPSTGVWISRYVDVPRPGAYVASAGGAMAWGFPAAMGMALARPDDRVVCLSGDGSFWMVAQDLETAVRERIPVVVVVANNYAYGNTRDRQRTAHGGRYLGVFYGNPDLAAFARLHGAHGERVTDPGDLLPALRRALDSGLPAIVDVVQGSFEGLPPGAVPLPPR